MLRWAVLEEHAPRHAVQRVDRMEERLPLVARGVDGLGGVERALEALGGELRNRLASIIQALVRCVCPMFGRDMETPVEGLEDFVSASTRVFPLRTLALVPTPRRRNIPVLLSERPLCVLEMF